MFNTVTISFFAFLAMFTAIGVYSAKRRRSTPEDYLIASRSMSPWMVALSAVATQNSGFMFIGLTGTAFASGIKESFWLMAGWVLGDYIAWLFVHKGLRQHSGARNATTIPQFLGGDMKGGRIVVAVAALITLFFLALYSSAQLTAGKKALAWFGIDAWLGVLLGAGMVAAYCIAGGIRASIWTDTAQSIVMFAAMLILVGVAASEAGGFGSMWDALETADPALVSWDGGMSAHLFVFFVLGWIFAGFGAVGQPHIMIRLMALDSPDNVKRARTIYIAWFAAFSIMCMLVGLLARVVVFDLVKQTGDPEMAFAILSDSLLPGVLVGVMIAGLFAATVSTADSQVLSCSAAITQDLVPSWAKSYSAVKIGTLSVTAVATTIAFLGLEFPDTFAGVFKLVIFAWSGLASSLGPLLVVRSLGARITAPVALAMLLGGLATVIIWDKVLLYNAYAYAALPGMSAGFAIYAAAWFFSLRHEQETPEQAKEALSEACASKS